jgi:carbon monoxide dehydrogenase subunit G
MKVERETDISAPPQSVYDVVMNPRKLEDWVTIHHRLDEAPDGQLQAGSELTQCLKLAGQRFHVHWKVAENDPCRRVVWEGRGPMRSRARVIYKFEPNGGGTHFSYVNEYELPGGPLGRMAGSAVKRVTARELDETLRRLKRLVEG